MLIAWQTVNAMRRPGSRRFTRGFLVVTPGITIRDRLRVLQPNDPDSDYRSRELIPNDMLGDLDRATIAITNYHAFMRRETLALSKGGRALLKGRGPEIATRETEGQMLQRVMPGLMGMKRIMVLNDEAHHCYREKPSGEDEEGPLKGDDRMEAERSTATTPAPSICGRTPASRSRRALSWCATTPPHPSSSTTTSRTSGARTRAAPPPWSRAGWCCSATSTSTVPRSPGPAPCSSTASSSNPDRRSTGASGPRPATRSSGSAARSSSARGTAGRPRISPTAMTGSGTRGECDGQE